MLLLTLGLGVAGPGCKGGGSGGGGEGSSGGEHATTDSGTTIVSASGEAVSVEAHNRWTGATTLFNRYEEEGWNEQRCEEVDDAYEEALDAQGSLAEAHYMRGLVASRCGNNDDAREEYEEALELHENLCKPRVALGVMALEAGNRQEAMEQFQRAVNDNPATCGSGYTNLARLQRDEASRLRGEERTAKETVALDNLRRALAINSEDMEAYNEMALLYYVRGKRRNVAAFDLAEIVCRQAQLVHEDYAPIYNTWGLIKVAREDINAALRFFARAITLDDTLYEAQMNFGQITFSFRGYEDAQRAFSRALQLRPRSYDAALGLGAAHRGLNNVEDAERLYNQAREIDGDRPEAYFNLAVLYHEYRGGSPAELNRAKELYQQFVQKAGNTPRYAETVEGVTNRCEEEQQSSRRRRRRRRSNCRPGRIQQIDQTLAMLQEAEEIQRQMEEMQRLQAEQEAREAAESSGQ